MEPLRNSDDACRHEWTYFVDRSSGQIRVRRCAACGEQSSMDCGESRAAMSAEDLRKRRSA